MFSYELLLWLVRASAAKAEPLSPTSEDAALAAYRTSVASGAPLSARALAARHGISRRQASQVVATVAGQPAPTNCPDPTTCTVVVPSLPPAAPASEPLTLSTAAGPSNTLNFTYTAQPASVTAQYCRFPTRQNARW